MNPAVLRLLWLSLLISSSVRAADLPPAPAEAVQTQPELIGKITLAKTGFFAGGFVTAFVLHESGHLITDLSLGIKPHVDPVWFLGFIPFFAIDSGIGCSGNVCSQNGQPFNAGQRGAAVIFSAGFQMQHLEDELILSLEPNLRNVDGPFRKGMFAFNTATSIGYVLADWIGVEPISGDIASMNRITRVPRLVTTGGLMSIAVVDLLRFWYPESQALPWTSRALKVAFCGSVIAF
jgi:hypothetical protein